MTGQDEFGARMSVVAQLLLGEPNHHLSNGKELRYGTHGSLSVDLRAGRWFDHENKVGGGVLDLVQRERRCDRRAAVDWLRENAGAAVGSESARAERPSSRVVARYVYKDAQGRPRHRTLRFEPKGFAQERYEDGRWIGGKGALKGVERVLYHEDALASATEVVVAEGEKDCDRLWSLGFVATTCAEGAGKWQPRYAEVLAGKAVTIIPDNDPDGTGKKHALAVAASLAGKAASVWLLELEGAKDVSDWLDRHTADELRDLIAKAAVPGRRPGLQVLEVAAFLRLALPPREMLLAPILPAKGLAMLYAHRGVGKTHVALSIAYATASGEGLFGWEAPKPRRVVYVDGEMPGRSLQERIAALIQASDKEPPEGYLRFIVADLHEDGLPDLVTDAGQAALEAALGDAELLVLDNLSSLCRSGRENEADSWQPIQDFLLRLRRRGVTVLMVHHAAKGGQQRGTSRREDVLDTVISLRRPTDYKPREGARFEVHIEKARGVAGEAVDPFEALLEARDGKASWTKTTMAEADTARVAALAEDGLSVREIADELGMSKTKAQRLKEKAIAEGKVVEMPRPRPGPKGRRDE